VTVTTSMRGLYERARRLLDLQGGGYPPDVQPVMLVGDAREAGTTPSQYRRFAWAYFNAAPGATTPWKLKAQRPLVITRVEVRATAWTTSTTLRTIPAGTNDPAATYGAPTTGWWAENFEAAGPPFLFAANGSTGLGRNIGGPAQNAAAGPGWVLGTHLFLRLDDVFCIEHHVGSTNFWAQVEGYEF